MKASVWIVVLHMGSINLFHSIVGIPKKEIDMLMWDTLKSEMALEKYKPKTKS